jgi:uncharacterized phage-associated protein
MVNARYDERKATQVACFFINKNNNKPINYLKLLKLMYLADREAFRQAGEPITYDSYCSMKNGLLLSKTYNVIKGESIFGDFWNNFIIKSSIHFVKMIADPGIGALCAEELDILEEIYQKFGSWNQWRLVDFTHRLPEYHKTEKRSIPVQYEEIMTAVGIPPEEQKEILLTMNEWAGV